MLSALSASAEETLPAGVVQKGTLADATLTQDAMGGALGVVAAKYSCTNANDYTPYILRAPQGAIGQRTWDERWFISCSGKQYPVDIHFQESGPGKGTDWAILTSVK
ncbi:MAG: hypothetical protein LBE24_02880, partial [Methylobacillus sp.]|jgi:hypothetical protein|nr:hypothetical protein [Methylobacillus sp.]